MDSLPPAHECGAQVHPLTMAAIVRVESSANPYAIGVVDGALKRQPRNKAEAVATALALEQGGWNFSLGKNQINRYNLAKHGLTYETVFDPCANDRAGALILKECYDRALPKFRDQQIALQASLSCYYSGNFKRGFIPDEKGKPSYVAKVLASAATLRAGAASQTLAIPVIPKGSTVPKERPAAATVAAPSAAPTATAGSVPPIANGPVMLQAVAAKPVKRAGVPAKYDGYQLAEGQEEDPHDGYAASNSE